MDVPTCINYSQFNCVCIKICVNVFKTCIMEYGVLLSKHKCFIIDILLLNEYERLRINITKSFIDKT